jgi:hypothetical protein
VLDEIRKSPSHPFVVIVAVVTAAERGGRTMAAAGVAAAVVLPGELPPEPERLAPVLIVLA